MSVKLRQLFALAVVLLAAGCSSTIRWPNWFHPGPTAYQRTNAVYTDPYPLDDVGPPVVGGRPRDYQRPVPEVTRGRLFTPPPGQIIAPAQPIPLPPTY